MKIIYDFTFLTLLLSAFIVQLPATIAASYFLSVIYITLGLRQVSIKETDLFSWGLAASACLLAALTFNHGGTPIFYLALSPFLYLSARYLAANSDGHVIACLRNLYWIFVLGIALGIGANWDDPEPLGAIFPWSSTNGIPSYLIVIQIAYSLAYYLKHNRLPVISSMATLVVAFFGLGRGSIIASALIFLISISVNLTIAKSLIDRIIAFRLLIVATPPLAIYVYNNFDEIFFAIDLLIEGSKFSGGVLDEHRGRIIADYLNKIDAWTLLFGMNYSGTSIVQYYGGNPHNSFIRMHSFYGLAGIIIIFIPVLVIALSNRVMAQKFIAVIFISISLLRATTEPIFFPSTLDFFYFLYFIIFFRFSKKTHKQGRLHV